MHTNRIARLLADAAIAPSTANALQLPTTAFAPFPYPAIAAIYQAAYRQALFDHELDRLFNPDYYESQR